MSNSGLTSKPKKNYGSTSSDSRVPEVLFSGTQFSPTEMYDLAETITTNFQSINKSWKSLEQSLKMIGTSKDSKTLRERVHVTQTTTNDLATKTAKDIQRLKDIVKRGDKEQKLHVDRLFTNFLEAVQMYSKVQNQVAEKMKTYILEEDAPPHENNSNDSIGMEEQRQALIDETKNIEFEHGLLIEKEERIRLIENDILDVNQIMRELGSYVHEQATAVDTIEHSVESVHGSVEAGTQELEKAATYQDKRRKKLFFLLVLSIIVGVTLAIIIASTLQH